MLTKEDTAKILEIRKNDPCQVWIGGCPNVENAAIIMATFKNNQFRNQEQTLLWTLYSILDKLAIEGEARDIAIKEFKEHLINKDL